jgi:hypothetical protein
MREGSALSTGGFLYWDGGKWAPVVSTLGEFYASPIFLGLGGFLPGLVYGEKGVALDTVKFYAT